MHYICTRNRKGC